MSGGSRPRTVLKVSRRRTGQSERRFAEAERHRRHVSLKIALPALALLSATAIFVSLALNQRADEHVAGVRHAGYRMPGAERHRRQQ